MIASHERLLVRGESMAGDVLDLVLLLFLDHISITRKAIYHVNNTKRYPSKIYRSCPQIRAALN